MNNFIIKPNMPDSPTVWDNAFLWNEDNVYIMANHRLALWCWMQQKNIFDGKYSLIHIDEHTDARRWAGQGEQECLTEILTNFKDLKSLNIFEGYQLPCSDYGSNGRNTRPCITWDNFVHLAAEARLFKHYFIFSSVGDWHTSLDKNHFNFYQKVAEISNLSKSIEMCDGKCIVDVDLDFFDASDRAIFPKGVTEEELLIEVFSIIAKHRDSISMLTISINEVPGYPLWEKRQQQLNVVRDILNLGLKLPIME